MEASEEFTIDQTEMVVEAGDSILVLIENTFGIKTAHAFVSDINEHRMLLIREDLNVTLNLIKQVRNGRDQWYTVGVRDEPRYPVRIYALKSL